jgi:hypothetical protein
MEQSSSLIKVCTKVGKFDFAAVYHEDIADAAVSSIAVPLPRTRRS